MRGLIEGTFQELFGCEYGLALCKLVRHGRYTNSYVYFRRIILVHSDNWNDFPNMRRADLLGLGPYREKSRLSHIYAACNHIHAVTLTTYLPTPTLKPKRCSFFLTILMRRYDKVRATNFNKNSITQRY